MKSWCVSSVFYMNEVDDDDEMIDLAVQRMWMRFSDVVDVLHHLVVNVAIV